MPGPVPYTDIGGGGPNPPHGEDFFNRIVNVHWPKKVVFTGGVFAAGDIDGGGARTDATTTTWVVISGLPFTNPPRETGSVYASAYGLPSASQPVFLLGGIRLHEEAFATRHEGIIMASKDGVSWQKVYSFVGIPYEDELVSDPTPHHEGQTSHASIHSIVWDGNAFWAGGYVRDNINRSDNQQQTESDVLLHSSDGFDWSEAVRNSVTWETHDDVIPELPKTGLLVSHCTGPFKDANGNTVPNGVWGENKSKGIKIGPLNPPTVDYTGNDDRYPFFVMPIGTNSRVRIIRAGGEQTVDTGVAGVMGVAFAGGVWWAVGSTVPGELNSAAGAYSVDDGLTWRAATISLADAAMTVCGGGALQPS